MCLVSFFRGFCSTCAIQLESCPICRQEISERKELFAGVTAKPAMSVPFSDQTKVSRDTDNTANGTKDSLKDSEFKGKFFRNSKSTGEVTSIEVKQKNDSVTEEVMDVDQNSGRENGLLDEELGSGIECTYDKEDASSINHIGGHKKGVTAPS